METYRFLGCEMDDSNLPNLVVAGKKGLPSSNLVIPPRYRKASSSPTNLVVWLTNPIPIVSTRRPKPSVIVGGATSAYLAISCDTTDNDGLRDASNDNESASQGDSVVVE